MFGEEKRKLRVGEGWLGIPQAAASDFAGQLKVIDRQGFWLSHRFGDNTTRLHIHDFHGFGLVSSQDRTALLKHLLMITLTPNRNLQRIVNSDIPAITSSPVA